MVELGRKVIVDVDGAVKSSELFFKIGLKWVKEFNLLSITMIVFSSLQKILSL